MRHSRNDSQQGRCSCRATHATKVTGAHHVFRHHFHTHAHAHIHHLGHTTHSARGRFTWLGDAALGKENRFADSDFFDRVPWLGKVVWLRR